MKKIEWFLNMIYYQVFRWENFTQKLFNYPIFFFLKKKKKETVEKTLFDKKVGFTSIMAGMIVSGSIGLFFVFLVLSLASILQINISKIIFALIIIISSYIVYNSLVERKYIQYFMSFENFSKKRKNKWAVITVFYFVIMISLAVLGFWIMIENNHALW